MIYLAHPGYVPENVYGFLPWVVIARVDGETLMTDIASPIACFTGPDAEQDALEYAQRKQASDEPHQRWVCTTCDKKFELAVGHHRSHCPFCRAETIGLHIGDFGFKPGQAPIAMNGINFIKRGDSLKFTIQPHEVAIDLQTRVVYGNGSRLELRTNDDYIVVDLTSHSTVRYLGRDAYLCTTPDDLPPGFKTNPFYNSKKVKKQ